MSLLVIWIVRPIILQELVYSLICLAISRVVLGTTYYLQLDFKTRKLLVSYYNTMYTDARVVAHDSMEANDFIVHDGSAGHLSISVYSVARPPALDAAGRRASPLHIADPISSILYTVHVTHTYDARIPDGAGEVVANPLRLTTV